MTDTPGPVFCYIARCKCGCGRLVFAVVDVPGHTRDIAVEIGKMIRQDYAIERMNVEAVRSAAWGCGKRAGVDA